MAGKVPAGLAKYQAAQKKKKGGASKTAKGGKAFGGKRAPLFTKKKK